MAVVPSDQSQSNPYAQVSSLYGPGTIGCWYLTLLSILISWSLHPQYQKSGTIDTDIIAALTLPAVAAGHLISQIGKFSGNNNLPQRVAAMEAPHAIVEIFMQISPYFVIIAAQKHCIQRALLMASIGLLCVGAEFHSALLRSAYPDLGTNLHTSADQVVYPRFWSAYYLHMPAKLVVFPVIGSITFLVGLIVQANFMLDPIPVPEIKVDMTKALASRPDWRSDPSIDPSLTVLGNESVHFGNKVYEFVYRENIAQQQEKLRDKALSVNKNVLRSNRRSLYITYVSAVIQTIAFCLYIFPSAVFSVQMHGFTHGMTMWSRLTFFPRTACSITDLDQVVALTAGATVLAFTVYSVVKSRYECYVERKKVKRETRDVELQDVESPQNTVQSSSQGQPLESEAGRVHRRAVTFAESDGSS